jgi:hypothetical protein
VKLVQPYADWLKAHSYLALLLLSLPTFIIGLSWHSRGAGAVLSSVGVFCFVVGGGSLLWRFPENEDCPRCHGKGYLINERLRVLEDCACQESVEAAPAASAEQGRSRPSALSERSVNT